MNDNDYEIYRILQILNEENMLSNIILIGSWCMFFYEKLFEDFEPLIRTVDIDFFVPNPKRIRCKNNIIKTLQSINFDFLVDAITNKSKFISPDGFELEFMTKLNRNGLSVVKIGNTGVYAEALSYLDLYCKSHIQFEYKGLLVNVASPESYVLQKLLINNQRKGKKEKDVESIKYILNFINMSKVYNNSLKELLKQYCLLN